jgi:hypothetical protein
VIGFLIFLVAVLIAVLIVKAIIEVTVDPPQRAVFTKIAMLIILLVALLWLFGGGGWIYATHYQFGR